VVIDEGITYRGTEEIRGFLTEGGAAFTYTSTLVAADRRDDGRWVAIVHLEGSFPGGVAELCYRFAMDGESVAELLISP
jgi:hypothetical protein